MSNAGKHRIIDLLHKNKEDNTAQEGQVCSLFSLQDTDDFLFHQLLYM